MYNMTKKELKEMQKRTEIAYMQLNLPVAGSTKTILSMIVKNNNQSKNTNK